MRPLPLAVALVLALGSALAAAPAGAEPRDHTFVFLRLGPKRAEVQGNALQEVMRGHLANIGRLAAEEKLGLAGPFGSPSPEPPLRGIFVFFTGDVATAQGLCQTDPAISAGVLAAEAVPFRTTRDLGDVLRRALAFEERRKADPKIPMAEGMSTYVLMFADDAPRASAALASSRAGDALVFEGTFGGPRAGQGMFVLDARDVAAGETLLAPVREALGPHRLFPWYGSVELRRPPNSAK